MSTLTSILEQLSEGDHRLGLGAATADKNKKTSRCTAQRAVVIGDRPVTPV